MLPAATVPDGHAPHSFSGLLLRNLSKLESKFLKVGFEKEIMKRSIIEVLKAGY